MRARHGAGSQARLLAPPQAPPGRQARAAGPPPFP